MNKPLLCRLGWHVELERAYVRRVVVPGACVSIVQDEAFAICTRCHTSFNLRRFDLPDRQVSYTLPEKKKGA